MLCRTCDDNPRAKHRRECNTCRNRRWVNKNPLRKAWHNLKHSAKRRSYEFSIPYDFFERLAKKTGYDKNRERAGDQLTINRIINSKGYTVDNIEVISKSLNSSKYHSDDVSIPF